MQQTAGTTSVPSVGPWLILLAAALWGTTGTAQALAPTTATPVAIGALRLLIGGGALLLVAGSRHGLVTGGPWPKVATALSILLVAAYQLSFFFAVSLTGVAVGTMVAIGSAPVAAGLLGYLVRGERLGRNWVLATALAVCGCCLMSMGGGELRLSPLGLLLALAAGCSYAGYTVSIKGLLTDLPADTVMAVVFFGAGLVLAPLLLGQQLSWLTSGSGLAVVLHLGLVATALSYVFFARGLKTVPVGVVGTLSLMEPLTAALLGMILLGERLGGLELLGSGLLFFGIVVLTVRPRALLDRWRDRR